MSSFSENQPGESRRSARLVSNRFYPHDDDTASTSSTGSIGQISYRESPFKVFKKKGGTRKGGGASPKSSSRSNMSKLPNPSTSEFLKARKSSALQAPSDTETHSMAPALSTVTHMDPADFSSGYSSSEEGYGRSSSTQNTTTEGPTGHRDTLRGPARAFAVVYFWLGVAWYSVISGMSLLDVSLLSRRTAGVRKALLFLILFLLLLFGMWYWLPSVIGFFRHAARSPPLQPRPTTHTQAQPHMDKRDSSLSFAALKDELYTQLHERETRWLEEREKDLGDVLKGIKLLKQHEEKQKRVYEMLQMDVHDLKFRLQNVDSEHRSLIKEETGGMREQISDLKLDMSKLQSVSEHLNHRMDTQESQNRKLKAELSEWLLQQLSHSGNSKHDAVTHPELQGALEDVEKKILDRLRQLEDEDKRDMWRTVGETLREEGMGALSIMDVERIVHRALSLHRADGIGMADYALESSGASVVNTRCSETYHTRSACISLFGFPLWYPSESPRTVIQPELYPGKCWPFRGSEGFLVIALSHPVRITHVTLEHLPRVLSPTGHIDSAPKDFAVYGTINEESQEGKLLGTFVYDQDGEPIQTFKVQHFFIEEFRLVELRILSNWGHPEYTCVYRFRVHGQSTSS